MKKKTLFSILLLSSLFGFTWLTRVYAQDADANKGKSQQAETRLEQKFNVSDARIDSLRKQGLGYGEIGTVFSLAQQMPGGITDANVNKITSLRGQGGHKEGWGDIAHDLNLKLRPADRDLDDTRGARHEEKAERTETQTHVSSGGSERFETRGSEGFHEETGFHGGAGAGFGHQR